ncbi:MAG: hypothetical protein IJW86_09765 [Clostridia bacterium]|nr:hypothetical protein [Clostridia bacterium]
MDRLYKCINHNKKIQRNLLLFTILILCFTLCLMPLKRNFVTYRTPEELFDNCCDGTIENIIYGDNSCMIYYLSSESTYSYEFAENKGNGYKVVSIASCERLSYTFNSSGTLEVYHIKNTDDYYVVGTIGSVDKTIEVYSGDNKIIKSNVKQLNDSTFIYGFLDSFANEHYMLVDGRKVYFN